MKYIFLTNVFINEQGVYQESIGNQSLIGFGEGGITIIESQFETNAEQHSCSYLINSTGQCLYKVSETPDEIYYLIYPEKENE